MTDLVAYHFVAVFSVVAGLAHLVLPPPRRGA